MFDVILVVVSNEIPSIGKPYPHRSLGLLLLLLLIYHEWTSLLRSTLLSPLLEIHLRNTGDGDPVGRGLGRLIRRCYTWIRFGSGR